MKFQVNQKVIALTNSKSTSSQTRVKGQDYTITGLSWCAKCGANLINIDNMPSITPEIKCKCGNIQSNGNLGWSYAHHFAPLTEESMEALAETEEYELAAIVRDNLNLQAYE